MSIRFNYVMTPLGYRSVEPMPLQDELTQFYAEQYFINSQSATYQLEYSAKEISHRRMRSDITIKFLGEFAKSNASKRLLELGCGEGFLLSSARLHGWDVCGVDYQRKPTETHNQNVSEFVHEADPSLFIDDLIDSSTKFDAVVIQNVLEHVIVPVLLLRKVVKLLSKSGKCLLQVPNDFSDLQSLAKSNGLVSRDYWCCPPEHLHYFSKQSLMRLAESVGLKVLDGIGDFPIELFLFPSENNYVNNPELGPSAHAARISLDLFLAEKSIDSYLDLCKSFYDVEIGRNICVILDKII